MNGKVCDLDTALTAIEDGQTVASVGVIGWITPDRLLSGLGERFLKAGRPRGLTFLFPVATGDALDIKGMDHVAYEGLMRRIVSGSYVNSKDARTGERPRVMGLIKGNLVEAYSWPIGATMHWLREVARRSPGYITDVGLGTYIDPRLEGGKINDAAKEDLVRVVRLEDKEYLFYPSWPVDVGLIRATSADSQGNLSFEKEPIFSSALAIALAAKASGGKVIAQVERVVPSRGRAARDVRVPGVLVDFVVEEASQPMGTDVGFDPAYLGPADLSSGDIQMVDMEAADRIISSRAAQEVRPGEVSIFGFGASASIPAALVSGGVPVERLLSDYVFTTEHGPFGGLVMGGWQFSANKGPEALLDGPSQFDFIDGGGCPFAALAFAEFDAEGNVNVSKFGGANPGAGGFIDIAANAKRLVFAGTFSTQGLKVRAAGGCLQLLQEGRVIKFVERVRQVTYRAREGVRDRGQRVLVVTERAVFSLEDGGLRLIEVAPGIDVRRDITSLIPFPVAVDTELKVMARNLFEYDRRGADGSD